MKQLRLQFIHGLEGSPQGTKAQLFSRHFTACTPAMNTHDFHACIEVQEATLFQFQPHLLVGSSFGGAVAVALLHRGSWKGPTLLLAPAVFHYPVPHKLPPDVPVWIVHGRDDEIVPISESRALAQAANSKLVRLIEIEDDHALSKSVASSRLVRLVCEFAVHCGKLPPAALDTLGPSLE